MIVSYFDFIFGYIFISESFPSFTYGFAEFFILYAQTIQFLGYIYPSNIHYFSMYIIHLLYNVNFVVYK